MFALAVFWILVFLAFIVGFIIDRRINGKSKKKHTKKLKKVKSDGRYDSVNADIFRPDFRIKAPEVTEVVQVESEQPIPYKPDLSKNTGYNYEIFCASLLKGNDFTDIVITPKSGDFGADLVATDEDGDRWVFQCKYYKGKVNNSAVQEVVASMAHYGADRAGIITSSVLTEQAMQLAKENNVMVCEKIGRDIELALIMDELEYN